MTEQRSWRRSASAGPDIALVGAARSGTSYLAAALAAHGSIDAGQVKEPDYFSSRWGKVAQGWYESLFAARQEGLLRLDASVSYTYPQHPQALQRLHEAAPDVRVVYAVREPISRLVSHYQLLRYYANQTQLGALSTSLALKDLFLGASNYAHWLDRLTGLFPVESVIVVPFPVVTQNLGQALDVLCRASGLAPVEASPAARSFRNDIRRFRHPALRVIQRELHRSRLYPLLRRSLGAQRLRWARAKLTTPVVLPSASAELRTLTQEQRGAVESVAAESNARVLDWLRDQDQRLGVDWRSAWSSHLEEVAPALIT